MNDSTPLKFKRCVGKRTDQYKLCAFTDSSKQIYGCVLYLINVSTGNVNFLLARNKVVSKQLQTKSIPCLELQGITLGLETLIDTFKELTGPNCVNPADIVDLTLCSDSIVSLNWILSYSAKLKKTNRMSVFVANRLKRICDLCEQHSVMFRFCAGISNPADVVKGPISYRLLQKSNYVTGISLAEIESFSDNGFPDVLVPGKIDCVVHKTETLSHEVFLAHHVYDIQRSSKLSKVINVNKYVWTIINNLKYAVSLKKDHLTFPIPSSGDLDEQVFSNIILCDQRLHFPEIFSYFSSKSKQISKIPNLVSQLNIYQNGSGLLSVKAKFKRWKDGSSDFPLLLSKSSHLTDLIIRDVHHKLHHGGVYSVLAELRKNYYIPHNFSVVKKSLKRCVHCSRFHNRSVRLNQSNYRDYRLSPPNIPFKYIFVDYFGPYNVKVNGTKVKIFILCITCLRSRAIELHVCKDMTVETFLRAFQLHIYRFGVAEKCFSDLGSNLVAAANVVVDFLKDVQTQSFFREHGIESIKFDHYFKGCSKLGSLVESCVKLTKRLIYGSVRNLVLDISEFELLIAEVNHLVNRRPVAFKEGLRDDAVNREFPSPITPEILIHGRELMSANVLPHCHLSESDPSWGEDPISHVRKSYSKLQKACSCLKDTYVNEFLATLVKQATSEKDKYKPVIHQKLKVGDIILLKEPLTKVNHYPLAIVEEVVDNDLGEVTGVIVRKGNGRSSIKRHVSSVIPLLTENQAEEQPDRSSDGENLVALNEKDKNDRASQPKRKAAEKSRELITSLIKDGSL